MQTYGVTCAIKGGAGPAWLLLVLVGTFASSGVFLGACLRTYFFMLTTAYLGAFLLTRGFGNLMGNYPNVLYMTHGEVIPFVYYVYVGSIFGLGAIGYLVQVLMQKKWPQEEDENTFREHAIEKKLYEDDAMGADVEIKVGLEAAGDVEVEVELQLDVEVEEGGEALVEVGGDAHLKVETDVQVEEES